MPNNPQDSEQDRQATKLAEELMAIGRHCANLPAPGSATVDEILGYDENGLPTQNSDC